MCDTFVYCPADGKGRVIFGKNSDREPNEAQHIGHYPRLSRDQSKVRATYITIDHKQEVNEVYLSRPFHMWGAEMGVNEHGLAIGNEAVFTRIKEKGTNTGLTGMDMLRRALEACRNADEALRYIIDDIETYGQDACGGYQDRRFFYHNAFIITDPVSAYILETAGRFWVYEKVKGYRALSNGLSIEEKFDGISNGAAEFAREKGWLKKGDAMNFRKTFSSKLMPVLAAGDKRRALSASCAVLDDFGPAAAFRVLRSHAGREFSPQTAGTDSICMHASGLFCPHQTTGSLVAELRPNKRSTVWMTGTSAPCLSFFKPFFFGTDVLSSANFKEPGPVPDDSLWWEFESFHRAALPAYSKIIERVRKYQDALEAGWIEMAEHVSQGKLEAGQVSLEALKASGETLEALKGDLAGMNCGSTRFLYGQFWKRQERKMRRLEEEG